MVIKKKLRRKKKLRKMKKMSSKMDTRILGYYCHSELVSESSCYYANLIYESINILTEAKIQL